MSYEQYEHHGSMVWVRSDLKGKHRKNCLCFSCKRLKLGLPETNCPKAQELYEYCVKHGMTTPVFECPDFEEM